MFQLIDITVNHFIPLYLEQQFNVNSTVQWDYSGKWDCNKVCEAVNRETVLNSNDGMKWRDLDNRLVQIS